MYMYTSACSSVCLSFKSRKLLFFFTLSKTLKKMLFYYKIYAKKMKLRFYTQSNQKFQKQIDKKLKVNKEIYTYRVRRITKE